MSTGYRIPFTMIYLVMLILSMIVGTLAALALNAIGLGNMVLIACLAGFISILVLAFTRYNLVKISLKISGYSTEEAPELEIPMAAYINAIASGIIGGLASFTINTQILGTSSIELLGLFAGFCAALMMTGLMLPYLTKDLDS